eukprot:scaffold4987_cov91-Isochrysis_galbana.AAC.1
MTHAHDLDAPHPHGRVRFGHNRTLHNLVERGPGTHGEGAHVSHESQLCRAGRLRAGKAAQKKKLRVPLGARLSHRSQPCQAGGLRAGSSTKRKQRALQSHEPGMWPRGTRGAPATSGIELALGGVQGGAAAGAGEVPLLGVVPARAVVQLDEQGPAPDAGPHARAR